MGDEAFKQRSEKQAERMWLLRGCLPHAESSRGETVRVLCEKAMKSSTEEQRQTGDHREDMDRSAEPLQQQTHKLHLRQWKRKELKGTKTE